MLAWHFTEGLQRAEVTLPAPDCSSLTDRLACHRTRPPADLLVRRAREDAPEVFALLRRVGRERLQSWGPVARLVPDRAEPGQEILRWRATTLFLPPALLLGALGSPTTAPPPRVQVLDPTLRPNTRVAHLHLHLGAAYGFEEAWAQLVRRHAEGELWSRRPLPGFPAPTAPAQVDERPWLHAALRLRFAALEHRTHAGPLHSCAACAVGPALATLRCGRLPALDHAEAAEVRRDEPDTARRRSRERHERPEPRSPSEAEAIATLLGYADAEAPLQVPVAQYLRVLVRAYRTLVMDPTRAGLPAFLAVSSESDGARPSTRRRLAALLADDRADLDLGAVEVRGSMPRDAGSLRGTVGAVRDLDIDESALILCYSRAPTGPAPGADAPRVETTGDRWRRYWLHHRAATDRIVRALDADPDLLHTLRGLDVAADERPGPLWLVAPWIGEARDHSRAQATKPGGPRWPLSLTFHVGEDFTHLLTGLRWVHEPFAMGVIERGDRLGHARALGLYPPEWCRDTATAYVTRWDRLLDLCWARRLLTAPGSTGAAPPSHAFPRLDRHIADLERELEYGSGLGDRLLAVLSSPGSVRAVIEAVSPPGDAGARALWDRVQRGDPYAREWDDVLTVNTDDDEPLLAPLVQRVAELVARWQTAIEVNPTSNLVIGNMDGLFAQPLFHHEPTHDGPRWAVPVTVGADDPLQFATTLADEFAYAWAGMVLGPTPQPASYARAWMEECARGSWRARFSRPPG